MYLKPLSKLNYEKVDKSASFKPLFDQPWMRAKIAPNLIKIGVHAYLSDGYLTPLSNINFEKVENVHLFNLGVTNLEQGPK